MYNPNVIINKKENWSQLVQLQSNNIDECLALENEMLARMQNKLYTCSYIARRDRKTFENLLKNKELYGIYDVEINKLIGIINISQQTKEYLLDHLKNQNNFLISDELLSFLKKYNGCYFACLMTDLDPKNIGLGRYIISQSQDYALNILKNDYLMCDIHVKHQASYRLFNKYLSFSCANKTISRIGVDNKQTEIPVFYLISILNKTISDNFESCLENDKKITFTYSDSDILKIQNHEIIDPVLNNDEILILNSIQLIKMA
jgi:hypothetical protein